MAGTAVPEISPNRPPTPTNPNRPESGDLDKRLLGYIKLGEDVREAASVTAHAKALAAEGITPETLTALDALCVQARSCANDVVRAKKAKKDAAAAEEAALHKLLAALRDVQKRAQRMFPKDKTKLDTYRIGKKRFGRNRVELEQDAEVILKLAADDQLVGLDPEKLAAGCQCLTAWKTADELHNAAMAAQIRSADELAKAVDAVKEARRGIQLAADVVWPYTVASNKPVRQAFGLPPARPARMG